MSITNEQIQERYDKFDAADNVKGIDPSYCEGWSKGWDQGWVSGTLKVERLEQHIAELSKEIEGLEADIAVLTDEDLEDKNAKIQRLEGQLLQKIDAIATVKKFNTEQRDTISNRDKEIDGLKLLLRGQAKKNEELNGKLKRVEKISEYWREGYWDLHTKYCIVRDEQNARVKSL